MTSHDKQFDREMDAIDELLASGEITQQEHTKEVHDLERSYREQAQEAAEDARREVLERFGYGPPEEYRA